MNCTSETRWKYLRETRNRNFDESRNTTLQEYLEHIFPDNIFEYNYQFKKHELPESIEYRRYRCDSVCKELHLVVEFDGVNHYMDTEICIRDIERDRWFKSIGYETIRIPYWIQLSSEVIEDLFHIQVNEKFCELDYNFYYPEYDILNFNILPSNMCELGRERFIKEFNKFRNTVRQQIYNDLMTCVDCASRKYPEYVDYIIPKYVLNQLHV